MNKLLANTIYVILAILLIGCNHLSEIKVTEPADGAKVDCDKSQGTDQCYIKVSGTAKGKLSPDQHICLYLKYNPGTEWWVGGGGAIDVSPNSERWEMTKVGIGKLEEKNLTPLFVAALVTDVDCKQGTTRSQLPTPIVEDKIQISRTTPTSTSPPISSPTPTSPSTSSPTPTSSPSPSPTTNRSPQPSVNITSPKERERVPNAVPLEGTVENLPKNEELWIVVQIGNNYYPHRSSDRGPVFIEGTRWSGTAYVGSSTFGAETGRTFTILIVAASKETGQEYTKYLDEADAKGSYPGIHNLFGGKVIKSITVIRDDSAAN